MRQQLRLLISYHRLKANDLGAKAGGRFSEGQPLPEEYQGPAF
jgi:hypothetical protein